MLEGNPFADLVPPNGQPGIISGPPEAAKRGSLPQGWEYGDDGVPRPVPGLPSGFTDPPKDKTAKDAEAKATEELSAGYYARALNAHALYGEGIAPRDLASQTGADILSHSAVNTLSSPARRAAQNYADDFIRAKLRKESGAVIAAEEMQREYETYFPVPGDEAPDLERKRKLREQAIEGLRVQAGPAADQIKIVGGEKVGGGTVLPATPGSLGEGGRLEAGRIALPDAPTTDINGNIIPPGANPQDIVFGDPGTPPGAKKLETELGDAFKAGQIRSPDDLDDWFVGFNKRNPGTNYVPGDLDRKKLFADLQKGILPVVNTPQYGLTPEEQAKVDAIVKDTGTGGAIREGVGDTITLGAKGELRAGVDAIGGAIRGEGALADLYDSNLKVENAAEQGVASEHPWAYHGSQLASGLLLPFGAARSPLELAKVGGALSGVYGFNSGNGIADRLERGGLGVAVGAPLSALTGFAGNQIAARYGTQLPDGALASAAAAERVRISEPMYDGNLSAINKAGRLEADPSMAPIIQQGFANTAEDIGAGVSRLSRGGSGQERGPAGEMVRQAAKDIVEADKEASKAAYSAAEAIDGDPAIDLSGMRTKLDDEIERLSRTPGTNEESIRILQRYRRDIDQPLPLSAVRDMRTAIRDNVNDKGLTATSAQRRADRRMLSIIEGTNDDIQRGLSKEGWDAWKEADALYAGQKQFVKDALVPFVGKDFDQLSGEAIFDRVKSAANSNGRALASLHRRLGPDQSRDIAATFAETLGRRGPDDEFSTALFISQARKLSPSARETLFGPSGADSFDNLLRLGRRLERAKSQVNTSKTARPVTAAIRQKANQIIATLLTGGGLMTGGPVGGGAGLVAGGVLMATGAARRAMSARALMNPRVSKWLLDGTNITSEIELRSWSARLGRIAAREPAISGELIPVQKLLEGPVRPTALAAEPGEQDQPNQ